MFQEPADVENAHILFVPRRTIECDELLMASKAKIEEKIRRTWQFEDRIQQFKLDLLLLEDDLQSLELPDDFRHFMLDDDDTYQVYVQNSIARLETVYGKIKYKYAKGNIASTIVERLQNATQGVKVPEAALSQQNQAEIDAVVFLDRTVDLISPFCVQQNYEGLMDENFGIATANTKIMNGILNPSKEALEASELPSDAMVQLPLTNEDFIFKEVRNLKINSLGAVTNRKLDEINNLQSRNNKNMSIQEMAQYMEQIKKLDMKRSKQLIEYHVNIAVEIRKRQSSIDFNQCFQLENEIVNGNLPVKEIVATLEAKMAKGYDKNAVLRLMSLLSTAQSGLKQAEFDHLRRTFIMCYGYQELATMLNLQDAKLFKLRDKRLEWNKIKTEFDLICEDMQEDPQSIHYVFGMQNEGLAPLSVKILEKMVDCQGFMSMQKALNLVPGRLMCPPLKVEKEFFERSNRVIKILVYFLGGVTFAEIAAIRWLNQSRKFRGRVNFVIATTSIISGHKCMDQMRTADANNLDMNELVK